MTANSSDVWRKFCQDLEQAGEKVLESNLASSELDKAEGLRYLTRLTRVALEMHLENADPAFPSFYQASHATAKIGSDNPDNYYQNATISGDYTYRISGTRGTVPIVSFATKANRYAIDGSMASTGEIDIRDVSVDSDGRFEIIMSQRKASGDWLPLEADSSILIVRQTFFDRSGEIPANVKIETIGGPEIPNELNMNILSNALTRVPAFVAGTSGIFHDWAETFRLENKNALNTREQSMFRKAGGDPMIHYLHGWWELGDNEALRITTELPPCEGWNFQVNNVWMESLDYQNHTVHTNNGMAELNGDGSVTLTVSHKPYSKNWIDTAGHNRGTMLWRWTGAKQQPVPKVELIYV